MSQVNYISFYLNIKDKNVKFINCYEEKKNNCTYKVTEASLSYSPIYCPICGCVFNGKSKQMEKRHYLSKAQDVSENLRS